MLVRHGTRLPKKSQIVDFDNIHSNIEKTPCTCNLDFKKWNNPFPVDEASELTETGMKELYCLAGRFHKRYVTSKTIFIFTL